VKKLFLLLEKNLYLIYMGISITMLTPYDITSLRWWIGLVGMYILVELSTDTWKKNYYSQVFNIIIKKYCWAVYTGMILSIYGLNITMLNWWIVNIPIVFYALYFKILNRSAVKIFDNQALAENVMYKRIKEDHYQENKDNWKEVSEYEELKKIIKDMDNH